jgi:hypothetical protein
MSRVVNSTLGTICTYTDKDGFDYIDVPIIINKNAVVKDAVGNLLGYEVIANIEKRLIPSRPSNQDKFTDDEHNVFYVGQIRQETPSKYYFVVTER